MHVGSSSQVPQIAPDSPFMANLAWGAVRTSGAMLSWLFSGMFTRFPELKIALSEGEIGWMPYFLERAEQVLDKQRYWVARGVEVHGARRRTATWTSTPSTSGRSSGTTSTAASSTTRTASPASTRSARTTSCARRTTRTRTPPGPTASAWSRRASATSRRRPSTSSCAATPRGSTGSPRRAAGPGRCLRVHVDVPVVIDRDVCMGSGMCVVYAPGTFAQDDEAKVVVVIRPVIPPTPSARRWTPARPAR